MCLIQEYELIKTEVDGVPTTLRVRKDSFSTFCTFNQLQGIIGNNGREPISKKDSCYVPAKQLLKNTAQQ